MSEQVPVDPPADQSDRRWPTEWWHLVYLSILVFQPALSPVTQPIDWIVTAGIVAVGTALYVIGERRDPTDVEPVIAAFVVVGSIGVFVNGGAAVLFVYAAALAGRFASRARAQRWMIGMTLIMLGLFAVSPIPLLYRVASFAMPVAFVWIVGYQVMYDIEREREAARLRVDNARVERLAMLGERERIARDLHDLIGHTLTGIVVRAQLIRRLTESDPARAAHEAEAVEQIARGALAEVRDAVSGWRHHALDVEIDGARAALTAADVALSVEQDTAVSLSSSVEAALALAVREAVTNVVRHADATTCTIGIVASDDDVRLTVADDGVGSPPGSPEGAGLAGMRERIAALGGRLDRNGAADGTRGMTLTVTLPAQQVSA
ncbi:sensor histidine kinase [soil metagenome]